MDRKEIVVYRWKPGEPFRWITSARQINCLSHIIKRIDRIERTDMEPFEATHILCGETLVKRLELPNDDGLPCQRCQKKAEYFTERRAHAANTANRVPKVRRRGSQHHVV